MVELRDKGLVSNGVMPTMTTPMVMSIASGAVSIPELPSAARLVKLTSPTAVKMEEFAIHLHNIDEAFSAWKLVASFPDAPKSKNGGDDPLLRAGWTATIVAYIRCFTDHDHKLVPEKVFGSNQLALAAHEHFRVLRSKYHAHDINGRRQSFVGGALDADGNVLAIVQHQIIAFNDEEELSNMHGLISDVRKYLESEIDTLRASAMAELEALSPSDRLALPEHVYRPVTSATNLSARRQGKKPK